MRAADQDLLVKQDHLVLQERMEYLEKRVHLDSLVLLVGKASLVREVLLDCLEALVLEVQREIL